MKYHGSATRAAGRTRMAIVRALFGIVGVLPKSMIVRAIPNPIAAYIAFSFTATPAPRRREVAKTHWTSYEAIQLRNAMAALVTKSTRIRSVWAVPVNQLTSGVV